MASQAAVTVETLLGVNANADDTRLGLASSIMTALPVITLDRLAGAVVPDDASFKFRLIPKTTLERRRKSTTRRLTSDEGDRLARLAKVYIFALSIYRDSNNAREFVNRPHAMLEGKLPLDVALATGPGADAVISLMGSTAYGGSV